MLYRTRFAIHSPHWPFVPPPDLATGDRNGGVVLWEAASGQEMFALPGHKGAITALTWRGDSEMFVSASEDGTLKLWKASDGAALKNIPAHTGGALSARFAHDGRVVSSGRDNKVQIWDLAGKNLLTLAFGGDLPNRVTFSDDDKKIIGSDWTGKVFVWDTKSGKALGELEANPPTLTERVQQGTQRLAALQAVAEKANAVQIAAETDARVAQVSLEQAKKSLAEAKTRLAAHDDAAEVSQTLTTRIAALQKEIAESAKVTEAKAKQATEAKAALEDATARLAAAKSSLAKWQAVQQSAKTASTAGKVSIMETGHR